MSWPHEVRMNLEPIYLVIGFVVGYAWHNLWKWAKTHIK